MPGSIRWWIVSDARLTLAERVRDVPPGSDLMVATLELAVPLWIMRVREWTEERRMERARIIGYILAEHGDDILFQGPKKGDTTRAFNAMAEGVAIAAFSPGGVTFMGHHWEAT